MDQITLFDVNTEYMDETIDRSGRSRKPPKWMRYERCENCARWQRYDVEDQPPCGWGIYGFCAELKGKHEATDYCGHYEDKRRMRQ